VPRVTKRVDLTDRHIRKERILGRLVNHGVGIEADVLRDDGIGLIDSEEGGKYQR